MLLRFTKAPPAAPADTLVCTRANGTAVTVDLPKQGILPPAAFHYVITTTLGWPDTYFGQLTAPRTSAKKPRADAAPPRQSAALAECLAAEQWGGATDPAAFAAKLATACRRQRVPPPVLAPADLARLRAAVREFGAAWRPLNPGQSLERTL